ncbi:MAG: hypothetical protein AAGK02_14260, partial [Pseudomonadota bacterium]
SSPMQHEAVLEHITLRARSSGEAVPGVFFQSRYDLWSADGTRLTLLLDPGRVKSGLDASDALGSALVAGERYSLEINSSVLSADGCALQTGTTKEFTVGPADVEIPSLDRWRLNAPQSNTRDPISIALNGPHDHVSLAYRLRVRTYEGQAVAGSIELSADETEWHFTPRSPWSADPYVVRVNPALEDLAGNRLAGLFDDPTGESRVSQSQSNIYELEFWPAD